MANCLYLRETLFFQTVNSVSDKSAKPATPVVNGIGESPSHPNLNICNVGLSGDIGDNKKRTADLDDINHLHFNQKNGIKMVKYEPEKWACLLSAIVLSVIALCFKQVNFDVIGCYTL